MTRYFLPVLLLLAALAPRARATAGEVDLDFAFTQLQSNGPTPFASLLYPESNQARQFTDRLTPLLQGSGAASGYEIVSRRFLTKRVERLVIVFYFEKFPLYLRVDYYDTTKGKICLPALVSKDAAEVLPSDLIAVTGK